MDFSKLDQNLTLTDSDHSPEQEQEFARRAEVFKDIKKEADKLSKSTAHNQDFDVQVIIRPKAKSVVDPSFWTLQLSAIRQAITDPEKAQLGWKPLLVATEASYPFDVTIPERPYQKVSRANLSEVKTSLKAMGIRYRKELKEPPRLLEALRLYHLTKEVEGLRKVVFEYSQNQLVVANKIVTPDSRGRYRYRTQQGERLDVPSKYVDATVNLVNTIQKESTNG